MNIDEEIQSGIRSLELDSSEQTNGVVPVEKSNGVVPVEEVKSVKGNGVVPMEEVKSVDTETSAKKDKEETNGLKIELPRRISEKDWKSYVSVCKFLYDDDDDDDSGLPPLRPLSLSQETNGLKIELPRRISEKDWKSYLSVCKLLNNDDDDDDDDDDDSGLPPLRPLSLSQAVEHHHFLIDDDLSMLSDDPEICTSGDVEPFPFPGCGPIPGFIPISKVKENAIDNSLLIDHLSEGTGAEDLLKLFSIYGHVTQILIPTDKTTGRLESFGLVFFRNIDDAERALNSLNEEGYHVEWFVDDLDIVFRTSSRLVEYYYCE